MEGGGLVAGDSLRLGGADVSGRVGRGADGFEDDGLEAGDSRRFCVAGCFGRTGRGGVEGFEDDGLERGDSRRLCVAGDLLDHPPNSRPLSGFKIGVAFSLRPCHSKKSIGAV